MTQKTLPRGNVVTAQTWDSFGRVATQADGNGNTWRFTYNSDGSTTAADPAGHTRRYAFNSSGSLLSFTNENGATQTYTYDAAGRRNSYTDSLGHQGHFTFDAASGKLATYTEPDSSTSSYTYSAQIQAGITFRVLTRVSHPDGTTHQFTYDPSGNLLTMVDQAGKTISFTYNSAGQVLTMTNPAGGVTTLTYAADGTVSTITDAAGNTTALGHDAVRRLNLVIHPDGTTRSYVLDPSDQMVSDTDERGKTARFAYDVNGNLTSITDPLGNVTSIGYDALDRPVSATDATGNKVSRTYDSVGRIASRTDRNGNTFTYSYDAAGNRTGVTDPGGSTWRRTYDSEGLPVSYTDPLNNTWTYNHDAFGRVVKSTSPAGAIFSLGYDISGRLSSLTDPSTNVTTFSADPRGLLAGIRQAGGVVASAFARTDLGQVSQVIDPNGQIWRHGYDSRGRTVSSIDPLGAVTSLTYNNMNRVTQVAFPGGLGSLQLTYDAQGNIVRKLYSDGTDLSFAFDDAERPVSAIGLSLGYDAMGEITSNNGLTVTRDNAGRITVISYGPGKNVNYTYDNQNRLIGVTDWLTGVTRFTYDSASRRTSNLRIDGSEVDFTYNADGFLTGMKDAASTTLASITLQRDARGQITSAARNVPLAPVLSDSWLPLSYDADSQVSVFTYDALGRLTNDVNRTYSWDLASRLTSYADVLGSVSFTYDAFGRRISRTSGGQTQNYVWDYALDLPSVSVIRQNGNDLRYYVYTPSGELLYSIEAAGNARHYYHFDETGNTLFLTNDTGAITDTYAYSPYGVPLGRTGTTDNPFTYGGEQGLMQETPSGLYYVRSRYYDAPTARFISRDPARRSAAPNETNPYTFVRMNPLLFTDPTGLNAQVNGDLTDTMGHTDISVDVWQGDQIIGTLNASFGEGGYRRRKNNPSDDSSSGGVLFNGQGTFNVSFQPGTCISSSGGSQTVFVPGSREQDERTAQAILNSVDWGSINKPQYQAGTPAGAFLKQLLKNQPTATGNTASVLHLSTVKGSGDWTKYGVIYPMRTCNTFTGSMLNVYFGESNTTGVMASSVKDNLDEHKVNVDIQKANSPTVRPFPGTEGGDNIVIWMDYPK
jgi:RHS repeat-associated protein